MSAKTSGRIVGPMLLIAFSVDGGGSVLAASVPGSPVALVAKGLPEAHRQDLAAAPVLAPSARSRTAVSV